MLVEEREAGCICPAFGIDACEREVDEPPAALLLLHLIGVEQVVARDAGVGAQIQAIVLPAACEALGLVLEHLLDLAVVLLVALLDLCLGLLHGGPLLAPEPITRPGIELSL